MLDEFIKKVCDDILDIAWGEEYYYSDRLRLEKLILQVYTKGYYDGINKTKE